MCGISGVVASGHAEPDWQRFVSMTDLIAYRGPDDFGFAFWGVERQINRGSAADHYQMEPAFGGCRVALGNRRLSILDLSKAGHQPMSSQSRRTWITHNGEIYNYRELREELAAAGDYRFTTGTDTEVILAAYEHWGADCFPHFNGMWATAILDTERQVLLLSRDRLGIKPLYYTFLDGNLLFASEIKQLLHFGVRPRMDLDSAFDYVVMGLTDHTERTFFDGIRQLPGGTVLEFDLRSASASTRRYWDLEGRPSAGFRSPDEWVHDLRELLVDSVGLRMRSDVTIGSCLSGGVDSASVFGVMGDLLGGSPATAVAVTACFPGEPMDETEYAGKSVARVNGEWLRVYPSYEMFAEEVEELVYAQDEPFFSLSVYAQYSVMKRAHEAGVKVLLDGQGGDELFLGYERYYADFVWDLFKKRKLRAALTAASKASRNPAVSPLKIMQWVLYFNQPLVRAAALKRRASAYVQQRFMGSFDVRGKVKEAFAPGTLMENRVSEISRQLPHLLKYEDRNSMAHSVEARVPFLDYRLVELALSMPSELNIHDGWTKHALRQAMEGYAPPEVLWRKRKLGFELPERSWLARHASELKRVLSDAPLSERLFNVPHVLRAIDDQSIDHRLLWRIYNMEQWMRVYNVEYTV
jgi:asparagine synthase (glutamine-hydrolysing)